jgi:hypothetical protein
MLKYLLDEHIPPAYRVQMLRRAEALAVAEEFTVWAIGDPDAPTKGTLDPEILCWCEEHGFALVTNNRRSMPVHLADHLAQGLHVPGIFIINLERNLKQTVDELILIAYAALEAEFADRISFLPVT